MGNEYYYSGEMDVFDVFGGIEAGAIGFVGAVALIYGVIMLLTLAFSVTTYVLHSLGLYTIAQRRRIRKPWLAWIPVGNLWLLGSISDQYQYVAKGKVKGRRKIMLGLSIGTVGAYFVWFFCMIVGILLKEHPGIAAVGFVLIMLLGLLTFFAVVITLAIFEYLCYYDLYRSCDPDNCALYLVLSILFSAVMPFFVFACRKKDNGMPLRKQPAPAAEEPVEIKEPEVITDQTEGESENEQEIPVADA